MDTSDPETVKVNSAIGDTFSKSPRSGKDEIQVAAALMINVYSKARKHLSL